MRVLLTGVGGGEFRKGFIASHFLELYKDVYDIVVYDRDIRDEFILPEGIDMVVHLAALAGVRRSHEEPELYWDTNVVASQRLFTTCSNRNVPVVYASSSSVYEWWLSPYASTKWFMEYIAPALTLGLRFHTVYGPNSREDMLYSMLENREVSYLTNHTRDWTHVYDVSSAISLCIDNFAKICHHRAIDVGTADPVRVADLAECVWPGNDLPIKEVTGEREGTLANPMVLRSLGWKAKHHVLFPTFGVYDNG
jgi:nucleoside-diphosphate-sugar epimerase